MSDLIKKESSLDSNRELIRKTIAKDCDEQEFELFMEVCRATGLNPIMRQIYPIARYVSKKNNGKWEKEKIITYQSGIDGFRLTAERTQKYAGSSAPVFSPKLIDDKYPEWAKVTVRKIVNNQVYDVEAIAYWNEYKQEFYDKESKITKLGNMWEKMPRTMLAKCAEALALRKAFPVELSNIYTKDEMQQAENEPLVEKNITPNTSPKDKADKIDIKELVDKIVIAQSLDELNGIAKEISTHDQSGKISPTDKLRLTQLYKNARAKHQVKDLNWLKSKLDKIETFDGLDLVEQEAAKTKLTDEEIVEFQELCQAKHDEIVEKQGGDNDEINL